MAQTKKATSKKATPVRKTGVAKKTGSQTYSEPVVALVAAFCALAVAFAIFAIGQATNQ